MTGLEYVARLRAISRSIKAARDFRCDDCGEVFLPTDLAWHHRDPSNKKFEIGSRPRSTTTIEDFLAEILKCDLVCNPCHVKRHRPSAYTIVSAE